MLTSLDALAPQWSRGINSPERSMAGVKVRDICELLVGNLNEKPRAISRILGR